MSKRNLIKIIGLMVVLSMTAGVDAGITPYQGILTANNNTHSVSPAIGHLNAETLYRIGTKFQLGRGVLADPDKAFRFYLAAAKKGLAKAQYMIGLLYANDSVTAVTVADHVDKALYWLQKAARQGHRGAIASYNYLLKNDFFVGC